MNCKDLNKILLFYIQGELAPETQTEAERHISSCHTCQALFNELNQTLDVITTEKNIPDNPFFYTRLKQRIESIKDEQSEVIFSSTLFKSWHLIPLSLLIIIGIAFGILLGNSASTVKSSSTILSERSSALKASADEYFLNDINQDTFYAYFQNDKK